MVKKISQTLYFAIFTGLFGLGLLMIGTSFDWISYDLHLVLSGSMRPTIDIGSLIVVRPAEVYQVGDVVTFKRSGDQDFITHRISAIEKVNTETLFTVQGDANNVVDQRPVRQEEIEGRLVLSLPYVGYVVDFFRHPAGFVLLIVLPSLWIIYEQLALIRREVKVKGQETNT